MLLGYCCCDTVADPCLEENFSDVFAALSADWTQYNWGGSSWAGGSAWGITSGQLHCNGNSEAIERCFRVHQADTDEVTIEADLTDLTSSSVHYFVLANNTMSNETGEASNVTTVAGFGQSFTGGGEKWWYGYRASGGTWTEVYSPLVAVSAPDTVKLVLTRQTSTRFSGEWFINAVSQYTQANIFPSWDAGHQAYIRFRTWGAGHDLKWDDLNVTTTTP